MTPNNPSKPARDWLAVRFYRLAGRAYAIAGRIESTQPRCPECGFESAADECVACIERDEQARMVDEAYRDGQADAWRDAQHEFGLADA